MQWFRFKVKVRNGRPTTRVPAKTNDLATVIGTSGSSNTQMAVAGLNPIACKMERPSVGGCPATPTNTIMCRAHRTTNTAGDIQRWVVWFDALGHHTRHRYKQRGKQTQQTIKMRIGREP